MTRPQTVAAWAFVYVPFMVLATLVALALCVPLFDAAWRHFEGSPSTVLRWLVCTSFALLGLGLIEWVCRTVADAWPAQERAKTARGRPIAH